MMSKQKKTSTGKSIHSYCHNKTRQAKLVLIYCHNLTSGKTIHVYCHNKTRLTKLEVIFIAKADMIWQKLVVLSTATKLSPLQY